jgi:hypothetical protein
MHLKTHDFAGLFAGLCLLSACTSNQMPPQSPLVASSSLQRLSTDVLTRYYPMTPGLQWTYALEQFQDDKDNTRFKTMTITAEAESSPAAIILRRSYPDSPLQPRPSLARRLSDRVLLSHYESPLLSSATVSNATPLPTTGFITALQSPLSIGQSWPGRAFQGGTETISVAALETLQLPAGNFETLRIEHHLKYDNGREDVLRYWYAPEVGLVKMYEEISFHTDRWVKFKSTGVLQRFQKP